MQPRWPKVAQMLLEPEEDILAYKTFPKKHHRSIRSVNLLERINREIRRAPVLWVCSPIENRSLDWLGHFLDGYG